jgi:hypothetical protein
VHHDMRAGPPVGLVVLVGIADVEGQVVAGVRIHLRRGDGVEAFGRLAIALLDLRAEHAGPLADVVGLEQRVLAGALLLPDLELRLFFEQADEDGRGLAHPVGFHLVDELLRDRADILRDTGFVAGAGGERKRRRSEQRGTADECEITEPHTPPSRTRPAASPSHPTRIRVTLTVGYPGTRRIRRFLPQLFGNSKAGALPCHFKGIGRWQDTSPAAGGGPRRAAGCRGRRAPPRSRRQLPRSPRPDGGEHHPPAPR